MKPTHLDLFSGIGGFALAAQWAGFETIGFSEIDPYASQVLKKHWPTVINYGDVRTVPTLRCDLITGGFPCQPHSFAGPRRGAKDHRHLWPAMRDVIGRCQPTWVCGENVPGIIGVELDQVLSDLESLGYRVQPLVIPACAVDAPHRRERVWIVAHAIGPGLEGRPEQHARKELQTAQRSCEIGPHIWPTEPSMGRMADGLSGRVDRLKGLGNAIVPQVAQVILSAIRANLP